MTGYIPPIISLVLYFILASPLFPKLIRRWEDPDYSHGFLIPLVAAYFLWRNRKELKEVAIAHSWVGVFIVLLGAALLYPATLGYQFFTQAVSMLIILLGLIFVHAGPEMVKKTSFSLFYLIFMIPIPTIIQNNITFRLRLFSTKIAFFFIKLMGITATRAGNIIELPTTQLFVADPCSGLRSLTMLVAASFAIGYIYHKKIYKRVILVCFSAVLAVLINVIRITSLAVIADFFKMEYVSDKLHDNTFIVLLGVGLVVLFFFNVFLIKLGKNERA